MIELTEEQINIVHRDLSNGGLKSVDLLDDVLDHVCCSIESFMERGMDFESAYSSAKDEVCPEDGWEEIQEHTDYLIKFKHHIVMRKFMQAVGITGAFLIFIGAIFKLANWPEAGVAIVTGYVIVTLIQLPVMLFLNWRESVNRAQKLMHVLGFISGFMIVNGVIYKVQHWPGAAVMLYGGVALFVLGFIPAYFYNSKHENLMPSSPLNAVIVLLVVSSLFVAFGTKNDAKIFIREFAELNRMTEMKVEKQRSTRLITDSTVRSKVIALEQLIDAYQEELLTKGEMDVDGHFNWEKAGYFQKINKKDAHYLIGDPVRIGEIQSALIDLKKDLKNKNSFGFSLEDEFHWAQSRMDFSPTMIHYYRLSLLEMELASINI